MRPIIIFTIVYLFLLVLMLRWITYVHELGHVLSTIRCSHEDTEFTKELRICVHYRRTMLILLEGFTASNYEAFISEKRETKGNQIKRNAVAGLKCSVVFSLALVPIGILFIIINHTLFERNLFFVCAVTVATSITLILVEWLRYLLSNPDHGDRYIHKDPDKYDFQSVYIAILQDSRWRKSRIPRFSKTIFENSKDEQAKCNTSKQYDDGSGNAP